MAYLYNGLRSYLASVGGVGRKFECSKQHKDLQSITQRNSAVLYSFLLPHCHYLIMQNETTTKAGTLKLCFEFVFLSFSFALRTKRNA